MKPLISIFVPVFNQAEFIVESLESALAQTYSPLEIIVSDDRSTDRTFVIVQEMAAKYRGPHKLILNQNEKNLGITGNVNAMSHLAHGELVLAAAGDDISLPERSQVMFEAWDATGRTATSLHSRVIHIDERGEVIKRPTWELAGPPTNRVLEQPATASSYVETLKPGVFGCAAGWVPGIFKTFGDLPQGLLFEDNLITLRSVLLGRVLYVDSPLVKYRLHGSNNFNATHEYAVKWSTIKDQEKRKRRNFAHRAVMYQAFCKDLETARDMGKISAGECAKASAIAREKERLCSLQNEYLNANTFQKAGMLPRLSRAGLGRTELREMYARLLPAPVFQSAKLAMGWMRTGD